MDFCQLIHKAQKNDKSNSSSGVRCYSTKFEPPKKEKRQKKDLSDSIKKFLVKKEEEERKKNDEANKKRDELLALRAQDKKATRRVNVMLKRTKSANQSVIEDAVDEDNTAVTLSGPMQPDEDDYGYVSQESSALYNKMMEKYSKMPDEPKFDMFKKKVSTNLTGTKDRVKAALEKERLEAMQPHKRKRKHKENGEEQDESEETNPKEEKPESQPQPQKNEAPPKPKHRPAPPPINFADLLKIAEKKQHEPVLIESKQKDDEKLFTKKQRKDHDREREWRERREGKLPPPREPEKSINPNRIPKTNNVSIEKPSSSTINREEKAPSKPSGEKLRTHLTNSNVKDKPSSSKQSAPIPKPSSNSSSQKPYISSSNSSNKDPGNRQSADINRSSSIGNSLKDMDLRKKELLLKEARSKATNNGENIRNNNISSRDLSLKQKRPLEDSAIRQKPQLSPMKSAMIKPKQFSSPDVRPNMSDSRPKISDRPKVGENRPKMADRPKVGNDRPGMGGERTRMGDNTSRMGDNRPRMGDRPTMGNDRPKMVDDKRRVNDNTPRMGDNRPRMADTGRPKIMNDSSRPKTMNDRVRIPDSRARMAGDIKPKQFPPADVRPRPFPPPDIRRGLPPQQKKPMGVKRGRILDDDDSEYDSELDDFIDDGPEGAEDYSSYIKEIFGYDKSRYRGMDEDDVDNMESNFAQQMKEEVISTKIGIMEDLEDIKQEEAEKKRKALKKKKLK